VLFSQSRAPRLKPRSGNKGKSKARTDGLDVTYVDASLEGVPLGGSHHWIRGSTFILFLLIPLLDGVDKLVSESPLPGHVNATATADVPDKPTHNARGKRAKAKSATRNSDSRAGTPRKRRKLPRAQNSDASEDLGSEDNLVPRGKRSSIPSVPCNFISLSHRLWLSSPCACFDTGQRDLARRRATKKRSTFREASARSFGPSPARMGWCESKHRHKPSSIDLSVAFFRAKKSFLPRSQPLRKTRVASLGTVSTLRLSSRRGRATLASGDGRMMFGMAARSSSQCRQSPPTPTQAGLG
jgi:hypothetical protein